MIARTWRGAVRAADGDAYLAYLNAVGTPGYTAVPGNLGVVTLRRLVDGRAEFLLLSFWESEAAVQAFAGPDSERAVFYPEDDRFLIERDEHVTHYEVVERTGPVPA
jgi:heme-degrading monooxygenase HmoA